MNVDLTNINLNTIVMLALAIFLGYLGIKVFKMIGSILSIALGIFLLVYVLKQIGITVPALTDILSYLMQAVNLIIDNVKQLFN
ncbi:MAG: hypothetical protein ACREVX_02835 [Clostridium sp.]|uniref:hypothetical protein n=1 Tax=Clostridium sp. TaxID=1506 RepID=UPI003D6D4281